MMKPTKVLLALVMSLLMAMPVIALANDLSSETEANIDFKSGDLDFPEEPDPEEVGFNKMQLNFGERSVPIRAEVYYADGESDSTEGKVLAGSTAPLTEPTVGALVNDARATASATGWTVGVKLSRFRATNSANPSFDATLSLKDGTLFTNSDQAKLGTALVNEDSGTHDIQTDDTYKLLLTATREMGKGAHGVFWENGKIALTLGRGGTDGGFDIITADSYQATLTWVLEPTT